MPIAVVTGANRGLGFETARSLVQRGFAVWLTARNAGEAERAAADLQRDGLSVQPATLDVASPASIEAFAERLNGLEIQALVNNAGASFPGFDARVAQATLDTNYRGAVRLTDALSGRLSASASVVMVSSGMGELSQFSDSLKRRLLATTLRREDVENVADEFVNAVADGTHAAAGFPSNAYSVSKALMNAFTRVLAREWAGSRRRVNAVCPGWVRTRMGGTSAPRSLEQGTSGIVWAAALGPDGPSGGFFRDAKSIDW